MSGDSSKYLSWELPNTIRAGAKFLSKSGHQVDILEVYCVLISSTPNQYTWIKYAYRTPEGQIGKGRSNLHQFTQLMLASDREGFYKLYNL